MRDNDIILLEKAYLLIKEQDEGNTRDFEATPSGYRPNMPKFSKLTGLGSEGQRGEAKRIEAQQMIATYLETLRKSKEASDRDPSVKQDVEPAHRILNILNNFSRTEKLTDKGIINKYAEPIMDKSQLNLDDTFLIGTAEMTRKEIVELVLNLITSGNNTPDAIKIERDPTTFEPRGGIKVDQYSKSKEGRDNEHYYLYRAILNSFPDFGEAKIRSRREKTFEGEKSQDLYYWATKYNVLLDGKHIGWYEAGTGFWPNEEGKKDAIVQAALSKEPKDGYGETGGMRIRAWNAFKKNKNITMNEPESRPFRTSVFVDENNTLAKGAFWPSNRRIPRRPGECILAPLPNGFDGYKGGQISPSFQELKNYGKIQDESLDSIRDYVDHYGAERAMKGKFPPDKHANLYKHGKIAGTASDLENPE